MLIEALMKQRETLMALRPWCSTGTRQQTADGYTGKKKGNNLEQKDIAEKREGVKGKLQLPSLEGGTVKKNAYKKKVFTEHAQ